MSFLPHLVVITLGIRILGLHRDEWLIAYGFGYGILLLDQVLRRTIERPHPGQPPQFRTALVEPVSLLWIAPLSFYLESPVPAIFSALRMSLDYLVGPAKRPFFPFSAVAVGAPAAGVPDRTIQIAVTIGAAGALALAGAGELGELFRDLLNSGRG